MSINATQLGDGQFSTRIGVKPGATPEVQKAEKQRIYKVGCPPPMPLTEG